MIIKNLLAKTFYENVFECDIQEETMWLMVVVVARKYILIYVVTTIQNLRHVITMGHFGVVK